MKTTAKIRALVAWVTSPSTATIIHRLVTAALALYVGLHRAGI